MALLSHRRPEIYEHVFAVPNGGLRNARVGAQLAAEGVKAGFPDIGLLVARPPAHGLLVELKYGSGRLRPEQKVWQARLRAEGYECQVCWGHREAFEVICAYYDREP